MFTNKSTILLQFLIIDKNNQENILENDLTSKSIQ
jgi:hypothetical protein